MMLPVLDVYDVREIVLLPCVNILEITLQSPFADISTVCVAGNDDHVDPPMDETACPLRLVRPLIFVPEMSRPAVF
jgi:hypothetical protein